MNFDEQQYEEGYALGKNYCEMSGFTAKQAFEIRCPDGWSEAKENGFFDAVSDYRKSLKD